MSGKLVFDDKANKTYIVKKPTRLCRTPDKPKCEECDDRPDEAHD